ncbi:MAG TPA: hypothetical protein VNA25_17340 [Phycisphaerae bacterium]|nr:hypothetical protein [Phycisphaerae bacterium]
MKASDLATLTMTQLQEAKAQVLIKRGDVRMQVDEMKSEIGQRIITRKLKDLEEHRRKYAQIPVFGVPSEEVALALVSTQNYEKFIQADLASMQNPEKMLEVLDRDVALCNDAIESKKKSAELQR